MKRTLLVTISMVVALATMTGTASATLTVRTDPNDTPERPDISKVISDLTGRSVFVSLRAWERIRSSHGFYVVLDTRSDGEGDRVIDVYGGDCVLYKINGDGVVTDELGRRPWRRLSPRELACRLPRGWFGIEKTVRFYAKNAALGFRSSDRAPNVRQYLGL